MGWQPGPVGWSTPAVLAPSPAARRLRRGLVGCFAMVVIGSIAIVGISVFAAFRSAIPGFGDCTPDTVIGSVDVPVTVRDDDSDQRITISSAQSQPGPGWSWSSPTAGGNLVITASLQKIGAGPSTVSISFTDWSFTPDDGSGAVTMNIVSGFEPAIVTTSLRTDQPDTGYLVVETPSTSGTLALRGDFGEPLLASWKLNHSPPRPRVPPAGTCGPAVGCGSPSGPPGTSC